MSRLTSDSDDLKFLVEHLNKNTNFDGDRINAMHEKLKAYEKTGLEPEELQEFMKRIDLKDLHDHISELLELEKQGLLIKLLCKVGDSVYFITQELDVAKGSCKKVIDEYIVTEIRGNKYNPLWFMASSERCTHRDFHPTQIGKSVFLTKEEAEKALKEMEGRK